MVTALDEMPRLLSIPSTSSAQFERPQKIICLLEMRAHRHNLVQEILDANDAKLSEGFLDDGVVGERDALVLDLPVASLVDQFSCCLHRGVPGVQVG